MTSFNCNYPPKKLSPDIATLDIRALTYGVWGANLSACNRWGNILPPLPLYLKSLPSHTAEGTGTQLYPWERRSGRGHSTCQGY